MVELKSLTITRSPKVLLTCTISDTSLPLLSPLLTSMFTLPTTSRRASRVARSSCSRLMRAVARVRRASTPLRIHTSSCASSLSALAFTTAS